MSPSMSYNPGNRQQLSSLSLSLGARESLKNRYDGSPEEKVWWAIMQSLKMVRDSCSVIKKRVAVIKPTSNEWCSNRFGDWKRNITSNTAKVTNNIEAEATCQRNIRLWCGQYI